MGRDSESKCVECDCGLPKETIVEMTAALIKRFSEEGVAEDELDEAVLGAGTDMERREEFIGLTGGNTIQWDAFGNHILSINESALDDTPCCGAAEEDEEGCLCDCEEGDNFCGHEECEKCDRPTEDDEEDLDADFDEDLEIDEDEDEFEFDES